MNVILFMISCILTNNFIFNKFLGCCPFLGVSSKVQTAASMGIAVTFVMTIASLFAWMVNAWVLVPLNLEYMQTDEYKLQQGSVRYGWHYTDDTIILDDDDPLAGGSQ